MERALTRRKGRPRSGAARAEAPLRQVATPRNWFAGPVLRGSPACKLFPIIRGCSLPVIVPARRVRDFHGTNSLPGSEFAYGASLSAQWPLYPAVREGMERALTRRKGSPACKLFPIIRGCSLPVIVPARRVADFHGTNSLPSNEFAYGASRFGAAATLSCCTKGDETSSNAPKREAPHANSFPQSGVVPFASAQRIRCENS